MLPRSALNGTAGAISPISRSRATTRMAARTPGLSHFGHGVLTFPIGYLFRTIGGRTLGAGSPNLTKDGIAPLDGSSRPTARIHFHHELAIHSTRPRRLPKG